MCAPSSTAACNGTIPVSAAATLLLGRPDLAAAAAGHLRMLGDRPEVDLPSLAADAVDVAHALSQYWTACQQLWEDLRHGAATGSYVMVSRSVHRATQQNSKKAKVDLTGELAACADIPEVADIVNALTDPDPDEVLLASLAEQVNGSFNSSAGALSVSVHATGALTWPQLLGGVSWPGEVRRSLTLTAKHAPWRDRRVRRLWRVSVDVEEVWPDPTFARQLLPAPAAGS